MGKKNICVRWFCYQDPYKTQCSKMVMKNNKLVQCKRIGKHYIKFKNAYHCDKHHNVQEEELEKRVSFREGGKSRSSLEKAYSIDSRDSSNNDV
uniref:Uncharacterized protein n=1 Tax=Pyramimonas orientalis virus TaxID=455367 RepID=A0A7M3UP40_POV01|nr:hypothetical protein HWQ62_00366 [Pyramimonas orientalis virus]